MEKEAEVEAKENSVTQRKAFVVFGGLALLLWIVGIILMAVANPRDTGVFNTFAVNYVKAILIYSCIIVVQIIVMINIEFARWFRRLPK